MQLNFDVLEKASFVVGNADTIKAMTEVRPMGLFSESVLDFFNALSKKLMADHSGFSDVSTFAFWCRRAHLSAEKKRYDDDMYRLGNGIVFHSTPSNVAVNFAFSFAAGLLAGNANIVRLPAKSFPQVDIICKAVRELLENEHKELAPYICMLKFPHDRDLYDFCSAICDTRVVWGGDRTISEMRKSPLPPRTNEITFADRFSALIIDSDAYLKLEDKARIAKEFYNDTFFTDQNACTSPRIILWCGQSCEEAKSIFWTEVRNAASKYELQAVQAIGKLHALYKAAVFEDIEAIPEKDCLITRVKVNKLTSSLMDYKYNSGFFYEYDVKSMEELRCLFTKPCQTLAYIGFDKNELINSIIGISPVGIDRVVPVGKTMDFSLIWDGYDLIRSMSRMIGVV